MWQYTFIIDQAKCAQKHQYEFQPWKVKGASDQELFSFEGQSEAKGLRSEAGGAATWINLLAQPWPVDLWMVQYSFEKLVVKCCHVQSATSDLRNIKYISL